MINAVRPKSEPGTPVWTLTTLPPGVLDHAAERSSWAALLAAASLSVFALVGSQLQSELADSFRRPANRLNLLVMLFASMGFLLLQRSDLLSRVQKLNVGSLYQVLISFCISMLETAIPWHPNEPVRGVAGLAIWLVLSGFLLRNAPLMAGIAGIASIACWPLAYWINLQIYGFEPLSASRFLAWNLPNLLAGSWMFFVNHRMVAMEIKQLRAEELGSYQLAEPIAQGGMGEVWRAKHRMLARAAAIKLIRPDILRSNLGSEEALIMRRFEREAQVTANLKSPHTVALYDFGQTRDGAFYYVMELLNGINLQVLVDRFGPVHAGRVVNILCEVCDSLEEAHRAGLVHRDIKPLNILLCTMGVDHDFVKVLDFGLVKAQSHTGDSLATQEGFATGTPGYIAPEAAMGSSDLDGRTDLYSLGCVAYFLLTGQLVFDEPTPMARSIAHVQKQPVRPSERTEIRIPASLEEIVMKLLEKNPNDRIATAWELARRLRALDDVPKFCEETAAEWWNTNLPNESSIRQILAEVGTSGPSDARSPAADNRGVPAFGG